MAFATLSRERCKTLMPMLLSLVADQHDWPPWTEEKFMFDLPDKWDLSFSGENCVAVISTKPGHPHLHLLAVNRAVRGLGLGTRALREALDRTGDELTLKAPTKAMRFYLQRGFMVCGSIALWTEMRYVKG